MQNVDYSKIMDLLPHRYPFLLVDKVEDIILGESARGIKNVTMNEQVFQGHFPKDPIFPGVLIVEAMAQTAAVLALLSLGSDSAHEQKSIYFMTIDNVKFRKPVRPGDVINLVVQKDQVRGNVWKFIGKAIVNDAVVSEANFMAMVNKE